MKKILLMVIVMFATMVAVDVLESMNEHVIDASKLQPLQQISVDDVDADDDGECEHCKAIRLGLISEEEA